MWWVMGVTSLPCMHVLTTAPSHLPQVGDGRDVVRMCIDATRFSNLGRFLNHSCDPNCFKQRVFCDHNSRLPRIAFFALRDIPPLEELAYDYGYQDVPGKTFPCLCGAWNCKKLLY